MSLRALADGPAVPAAFDVGRLGALTWLGLVVAGLGWALLLGAVGVGTRLAPGAHADLVEIARCLIDSGFALALIGALRTGFGALDRFFVAVLTRSAPRPVMEQMPEPVPEPMPERMTPPVPQTDRSTQPLRGKRPYQILADGSVEVETIVGTRRFGTMDEAREFI